MIRAALILFAAMTLTACATQISVGEKCAARDDCEPGLDCFSTPDGYCTRGCSELGQLRECPAGSVCTVFYGTTPACSTLCDSSADCRDGFACSVAASGSDYSACQPLAK